MERERDKSEIWLVLDEDAYFVGNKNEITGQSYLKIIKKLQTFLLENVK